MRTKNVLLIAFALGALVAVAGAASAEDPNPDAPRWVEASYAVSLDETMQNLTLDGDVDLRKVQPETARLERFCGASCSADELRRAYQRAGEDGKQRLVNQMEAQIESQIDAALAGMAGDGAEPTSEATVDRSTLRQAAEGDEYSPPIKIDAEGSAELGLLQQSDVTPEQVLALFQMGARVDQPIQQDVQAGTNLTLSLTMPGSVSVMNASEARIVDGDTAVWSVDNWRSGQAGAIDDVVTLGNPEVVVPEQTDAELEVTLDIANVAVEYGTLIGGGQQPAQADMTVSVDASFAAIENPREIDRVRLDYLSADAVRIALEHELLSTQRLIDLEDRARQQIKATLQNFTGDPVRVDGGFSAGDLSAESIGDPPGTGGPIELNLTAEQTAAFPPADGAAGAQGFTVTTLSVGDLKLPSLELPYDVQTAFTIVLPSGLDLNFDEPAGYEVTRHEKDGRKAYTFSSTDEGGSSQEASIQNADIVVNHPFVWNVFWPVIVALILLLVVLPAVVIGLTIRRRRKRGPPSAGETAQPVSGSQATQRTED